MPERWEVQVFYDGDCPLCSREIALLRWLDRREAVWFTDIAEAGFSAEEWGTTQAELMAAIRGRTADGAWVDGMAVFHLLYAAVGLGWLAAVLKLPGLRQAMDAFYVVFARNRLRWTGRCDAACTPETPERRSA